MPSLSGLMLTLVTLAPQGAPAADGYGLDDYPSDLNLPSLQVAFVFYDKANLGDFQKRAGIAGGIEDWERDNPHFVVSVHLLATVYGP